MDDLLRISFVLMAGATFLLCQFFARQAKEPGTKHVKPAIEDAANSTDQKKTDPDQKFPLKARKQSQYNIFVAGFLFISAIVIYAAHFTYLNDPLRILEEPWPLKYTGIIIDLLLGVGCGLLFHAFYRFIKMHDARDHPAPNVFVAAWVLVLGAVVAFGLFNAEAKKLAANVKKVETGGVSIEFDKIADPVKMPSMPWEYPSSGAAYNIYLSDALKIVRIDTDFRAGVDGLTATLGIVASDFKKIVRFCRNDLTVGPYCAPFIGDTDGEQVKEKQERLVSAVAAMYGFANVIKPVAACLNAYSCFHENGIAIQEDLSEIAAGYAMFPVSTAQSVGCPRDGSRDPLCNPVETLLKRLETFKKQRWSQADRDVCPYLVQCLDEGKNALPEARHVISHRDSVLATDRTSDPGTVQENQKIELTLPYRPMLSAALLTASGYPEEAAGHLKREYEKLRGQFGSSGAGSETRDFVEALLRLRLLYGLQQQSDFANLKEMTLAYQEKEIELATEMIKIITNVDGKNRHQLIEKCAENFRKPGSTLDDNDRKRSESFTNILQNPISIEENFKTITKNTKNFDEVKGIIEQWRSEPSATVQEDWDTYVHNFLFYFANADFRRLQARAHQHGDNIEDEHLAAAEQWWNLAIKTPHLIKDCFSRSPYASKGLYGYLEIQMLYTYGLLHAQKASSISQQAELVSAGLYSGGSVLSELHEEVQRSACKGFTALRRAYLIGRKMQEDPDWAPVVADYMRQIESLLIRLARFKDSCSN